MKKILRIASFTLMLVMLLTSLSFASTSNFTVAGSKKSVVMENPNGRTYIAGKSLNTLGLNISVENNVATVKNKQVTFEFTIDTNRIKVNGVPMTLDVKTYKKGQEVYLPLRFIMETLGYEIKWDNNTRGISASKTKEITYPITFEGEGKKYTVTKAPKTIVSLSPSVTETLFAIGAGNMIKGRTQYCTYPAAAKSIKDVGTMKDPSAEVVVSLAPELVIAATHYKEEVLNQFTKAGINVVAKNSPNTLDEMYDYTLKMGAIVGKNYEARALVSTMKAKVDTVEAFTTRIKNKPNVYYVVGTGQSGEYTAGRDTFIADVIKVTGGVNIANDITGWKYSLEKLVDNNPDIIFGPADGYNTMASNPNYSGLKAIKNKKYITVDRDIFSRPSPRLIDEGLKILVRAFHGNLANLLNF